MGVIETDTKKGGFYRFSSFRKEDISIKLSSLLRLWSPEIKMDFPLYSLRIEYYERDMKRERPRSSYEIWIDNLGLGKEIVKLKK